MYADIACFFLLDLYLLKDVHLFIKRIMSSLEK